MFAVIRVRGNVGLRSDIKYTFRNLRLNRVNHMVLVSGDDASKGMLQKCKDYITWGEISEEVLGKAIEKRGLLPGNKRVSEKQLKEKKFSSFKDLASKILSKKASLADAGLKPVFRLHPPRKGYVSIKKAFPQGALGFRGKDLDELVLRMV